MVFPKILHPTDNGIKFFGLLDLDYELHENFNLQFYVHQENNGLVRMAFTKEFYINYSNFFIIIEE